MKNRVAIFSLLLLFPTARLGAQTAGAQTPAAAKPDVMSSFEFVVGVWQPVADPAHPAKYVETLTYAPIHDGKFVASQQIYRDQDGKIIYKDLAVFGEDPDTHHLFFHAYNTDGSIDRSHAIDALAGQWIFLGTVYGSPKFKDYRYTMTKLDDDHMRILIELKKNEKFEKLSEESYERRSRTASPQIQ